ncbi:hypothetical protein BS47DRAFT_328311 [Hydnum rufescens UP504]|uniref:Defective in cullin neddylation protein n=1 Tax=Hydnum rufescens UP504 TaxID=1448309 RepID=A0A9P6B8G4_9AGAM|nr:hypothetical protein BS47DRAFT_328311 [Hydnum rufescens UP504]
MRIDTVPKLALALSEMEDQLYAKSPPPIPNESTKDPYRRTKLREIKANRDDSLKDLYLFAFELAKLGTARNIDIDTAVAFWGVILKPRYPQITDFIAYIEEMNADENARMYKGVTKDLWNMTLQFLKTVKADLSDYDPEAEWPTTLDAYAAWKKQGTHGP